MTSYIDNDYHYCNNSINFNSKFDFRPFEQNSSEEECDSQVYQNALTEKDYLSFFTEPKPLDFNEEIQNHLSYFSMKEKQDISSNKPTENTTDQNIPEDEFINDISYNNIEKTEDDSKINEDDEPQKTEETTSIIDKKENLFIITEKSVQRGRKRKSKNNRKVHNKNNIDNIFFKLMRKFFKWTKGRIDKVYCFYYNKKNIIKRIKGEFISSMNQSKVLKVMNKSIRELFDNESPKYKKLEGKNKYVFDQLANDPNVSDEVKEFIDSSFRNVFIYYFVMGKNPFPNLFVDSEDSNSFEAFMETVESDSKDKYRNFALNNFFDGGRERDKN